MQKSDMENELAKIYGKSQEVDSAENYFYLRFLIQKTGRMRGKLFRPTDCFYMK